MVEKFIHIQYETNIQTRKFSQYNFIEGHMLDAKW